MSADIATFMVDVNGKVESHEFGKLFVVAEAKLTGQIVAVVLILFDWDDATLVERIPVDSRGNSWQFGNEIHHIVEGIEPVILLVDAFGVCFGEGRFSIKRCYCHGKLSHRMNIARTAVDEFLDELG